MIVVPPKIWKLERENKYRVPDYSDYIDDGIFDYKVYDKYHYPKLTYIGKP